MFKNIKLFKMLGVDVFLNVTWFLIFFLFFTWSGTNVELFLTELATVIIIFGTVLLHEFGHVLAARKYGVSTDRVVLNVLGGVAFINPEGHKKLSPKQHMWVYFSGPLVNIILGLISLAILVGYMIMIPGLTEVDIPLKLMAVSCLVNLVMVIFNLLPIFPMDGGGILRNLLEHFKVKKSLLYSARISQVLCVALFYVAVLNGAWIMGAISILFFFYAIAELKKDKSEDGIIKIFGKEIDLGEVGEKENLDNK